MGRRITDYVKKSVEFRIADTESVSPLAQKIKERLDRVAMRSSVFMADMTYIVLR